MTREQLRECHQVARELRDLQERIARLDSRLQSPRSSRPRRVRGARPDQSDPFTELVDLKVNLEGTYREKEQELWLRQLEIEEAIDDAALTSLERRLMRHRYFDGMTWEEVAEKLDYEERQVRRIHGHVLSKMS